jgi:hypothetical protein
VRAEECQRFFGPVVSKQIARVIRVIIDIERMERAAALSHSFVDIQVAIRIVNMHLVVGDDDVRRRASYKR